MKKLRKKEQLGYNFSYPSSAAAVVFGVYLSAQAVSRLDRNAPYSFDYLFQHRNIFRDSLVLCLVFFQQAGHTVQRMDKVLCSDFRVGSHQPVVVIVQDFTFTLNKETVLNHIRSLFQRGFSFYQKREAV